MKPLEVQTADTEEMECELHSKEFFVQVGMLVLEGRRPQQSDRGRIEGKHCCTSKGNKCHTCDDRSKECKEAKTWTQMMESYWQRTHPLVIDVLVQLDEETNHLILLEQWTVRIVCSANSPRSSGSQLLQAVRSHIHFSQLSAWLSSSKGILPHEIKYRINEATKSPTYSFFHKADEHNFPLASLPGQYSLEVIVKSLPRCSIQDLLMESQDVEEISHSPTTNSSPTSESPSSSSWFSDARSPLRKRTCLNKCDTTNGRIFVAKGTTTESSTSDSKACCDSRKTDKAMNLEKEFLKLAATEDLGTYNSSKSMKEEESKLGTDRKFLNYDLIPGSNGRKDKLGREILNKDESVDVYEYWSDKQISGSSSLSKESDGMEERREVSGVKEKEKRSSHDMAKVVLQRKCRSLSDRGVRDYSLHYRETTRDEITRNTAEERVCQKTKLSPTRQGAASNSSDVDIHAIRQSVNRDCNYRRSVQLPFSACTEPVFNPKTGLPISSSPAPLRRSTNELYEDTTDFSNGLSNKVDYRELSKLLSRSAPASTMQSLLVNFEESVLNGRMEPVGTVEGFTAELSASGSFCPRHVKLPIISCFYRLSDDDAPSPYMGYISLKEDPIGRRGYHVPKKGTIQLTVFNPNSTVVKMFVVLYDYSDMPPRSQTFLRQKTYSALKRKEVKIEVQQTLHYLLHLRFASSKSGKIYLHTDIRVIFARQPPDLGNIYQLFTITDGPTNPKYTRRHHSLEDPEY